MSIELYEGTAFLLVESGGDAIPGIGRGFYYEDTRFLSRIELQLDGREPLVLKAVRRSNHQSAHFLSNPKLDGAQRNTLAIQRRYFLGDGLHQDVDIENYGTSEASFLLSLVFDTDFAHVFRVKQAVEIGRSPRRPPGVLFLPGDDARSAQFRLGTEGLQREVALRFSQDAELRDGTALFRLTLPRRGRWALCVDAVVQLGASTHQPRYSCRRPTDEPSHRAWHRRRLEHEAQGAEIETDHPALARAYRRAASDLVALRLAGEQACGEATVAAGIPWFLALFGRDSLITAIQTLLHEPSLAQGTLRVLARLQGTKMDEAAEEEPGKILHEYRRNVPPSGREPSPKYPFYGTVDATPLFVVALSEYARATGDLQLVDELWENLERAVAWMERYGDADGDGLLEYGHGGRKDRGSNEGWKDSPDAVRFHDGRIAERPIAMIEVQGYAADGFARAAELFARRGRRDRAEELRRQAAALRQRILDRFWLPERGYFAEALDGRKRPVDALTSNPGHLLWSGAVPEEHARRVADVLLSPAMFSGYGVRTMGFEEGAYNPLSYHNGSVWPHDNSIVLAGLVRYGLDGAARRLVQALLAALDQAQDDRLPELLAGFSAQRFGTTVDYPTANRPQAWSAGAILWMVRAILGLEVDAVARRVAARPLLVPEIGRLVVHRLPLGGERVDAELKVEEGRPRLTLHGLPPSWQLRAAPPSTTPRGA